MPISAPAAPAKVPRVPNAGDDAGESLDIEAFRAGDPDNPVGNAAVFNRALAEARRRGGGVVGFSRDYDVERVNLSGNVTLWGQRHRLRLVGARDDVLNVSGAGAHLREIVFESANREQYSAIWIVDGTAEVDIELCEFTGQAYGLIRAQQAFDGLTVRRCSFYDCNAGIVINDSAGAGVDFRSIDVSFNRARGCRNEFVTVNSPGAPGTGARSVNVSYNEITSTVNPSGDTHACIAFAGTNGLTCIGNRIDTYQGRGIHVEDDSDQFIIAHNILRNGVQPSIGSVAGDAIFVIRAYRGVIAGNRVIHCNGSAGIQCAFDQAGGSGAVDVTGNYVRHVPGGYGIVASGSSELSQILDNQVYDPGRSCFLLQGGPDHMRFEGNTGRGGEYGATVDTGRPKRQFFIARNDLGRSSKGRLRVAGGQWTVAERDPRTEAIAVAKDGWAGWVDLFELGRAAQGELSLVASSLQPDAEGVLETPILWDGANLRTGPASLEHAQGAVDVPELRTEGGRLQARVALATPGREIAFAAELRGWARLAGG